jgi:hypothetical protein
MVIVNFEGNYLKTSGLYLQSGHNGGVVMVSLCSPMV